MRVIEGGTEYTPPSTRPPLSAVLSRRWRTLAVFAILGAMIGYVLGDRGTTEYQATGHVFLTVQSGADGTRAAASEAQLATSTPVLTTAGQHLRMEPLALAGVVSASPDATADVFSITATAPTPLRAVDIVNQVEDAYQNVKQSAFNRQNSDLEQQRGSLQGQLQQVENALTGRPNDPGLQSQRDGLLARLSSVTDREQQLSQAAGVQGTGVTVYAPPNGAAKKTSPIAIGLFMGALAGAFIGALGIVIIEMLSTRGLAAQDAAAMIDAPLLGEIRSRSRLSIRRPTPGFDPVMEDYLETALAIENAAGRSVGVVALVGLDPTGSPGFAVNLAVAFASSGRSVILVDADLRRAEVSQAVGAQGVTGLSGVVGQPREGTVRDLLVPCRFHSTSFLVLPAGGGSKPLTALSRQHAFQHVLNELRDEAEVVFVSTPSAVRSPAEAAVIAGGADHVLLTVSPETDPGALGRFVHRLPADAPMLGYCMASRGGTRLLVPVRVAGDKSEHRGRGAHGSAMR